MAEATEPQNPYASKDAENKTSTRHFPDMPITPEQSKQLTNAFSDLTEKTKKRDEFLESLGPEGKELISELKALQRTAEKEAKSGNISGDTMEKTFKAFKRMGNLALDPDKDGTADPEHVQKFVDSIYRQNKSSESIAAIIEKSTPPDSPFGKTLVPADFIDSANKRFLEQGVTAIEKGLNLQVPPESAQIIADRFVTPIQEIATAGNRKFLDRGDTNNGNAGKGDGVLTAEEMRPAMDELRKQGVKFTADELAKTIEQAGLKASPELIKAAIGYQEYLEGKSRSSAKTPGTTDSPLPPDAEIRGGEHVPDGANLKPNNNTIAGKPRSIA